MKKTGLVKFIISTFNKYYNYNIEEFKSIDNKKEFWGMSSFIDGVKNCAVFIYEEDFNNVDLSFELEGYGTKLIKVLLVDMSNENSNWHYLIQNSQSDTIVLDENNERVIYSSFENEILASKIDNVLEYKKSIDMENKSIKSSKITNVLIALNVIMYIITALLSGNIVDSDVRVLLVLGANERDLVFAGQYFRLITSMFLHGGIVHLLVNMYSLNAIGPAIEKIYGKYKYISIYFFGGIISSIFSCIFTRGVSIGASGAIFALLGAILIVAVKTKDTYGKGMLKEILSVVILNIVIGLSTPNIDNFAHIGGLLGGSFLAAVLYKKER